MDKPYTVAYQELSEKLVRAINESNLPAVFIRPLLKEIDGLLVELATKQLANDQKVYEAERLKELSEEKKDEDA